MNLLALSGVALAGDVPVLFEGDADVALHAVAADVGVPLWQIDLQRPSDGLSGSTPRAFGGGPTVTCDATVANESLRVRLDKIEGRVTYEQWSDARADLDAAVASLACLGEPAESSLGARLFFLQGVTLTALGEASSGQSAFERALRFQPGLAWDEAFPPDWKVGFTAAQADVGRRASSRVIAGPGLEANPSLWIDGHMVNVTAGTAAVSEGWHLVQVLQPKVTTLEVVVGADTPVAIVVPDAVTDDLVDRMSDSVVQALVTALLADRYAEGPVYVRTSDATWKREGGAWVALPGKAPATEAASGGSGAATALRWGGVGAASVGLVSTAMGLGMYLPNRLPVDGEVGEAYAHRVDRSARGAGLATAGLISLSVGAVAIGVSVPLGGAR